MEINYPIAAFVTLLVIGLIVFLIRRNIKDKKKYEKEKIQSELKPEKHDDEHI